jgi:hypothetical protein
MVDGGDDKARVGQRFLNVMVRPEPTATAVRDNDQRQLCPGDRTVLHGLKWIDKGHRKTAERYIFRLPCAWIPNGACQIWIGIEKLNAGRPRGRAQTTQDEGKSPTRLAHQRSPQFGKSNLQKTDDKIVSKILRASPAIPENA